MEYRNRSEMASFSSNQLEMISQQQSIAVHELSERNQLLSEALVQSRNRPSCMKAVLKRSLENLERRFSRQIRPIGK